MLFFLRRLHAARLKKGVEKQVPPASLRSRVGMTRREVSEGTAEGVAFPGLQGGEGRMLLRFAWAGSYDCRRDAGATLTIAGGTPALPLRVAAGCGRYCWFNSGGIQTLFDGCIGWGWAGVAQLIHALKQRDIGAERGQLAKQQGLLSFPG